MMCPRCTTETIESKRVKKGQHKHFKIHLCRRCKGAWIDRHHLTTLLNQVPEHDLAGLDSALSRWTSRFERERT